MEGESPLWHLMCSSSPERHPIIEQKAARSLDCQQKSCLYPQARDAHAPPVSQDSSSIISSSQQLATPQVLSRAFLQLVLRIIGERVLSSPASEPDFIDNLRAERLGVRSCCLLALALLVLLLAPPVFLALVSSTRRSSLSSSRYPRISLGLFPSLLRFRSIRRRSLPALGPSQSTIFARIVDD